jgi:twitching motility protein PilJ
MFSKLKLSLQWKLIFLFAGSALIVFIVLFYMVGNQIESSLADFSQENINNSLEGAKELFNGRYEKVELALSNSAVDAQIRNAFSEGNKAYLKRSFSFWEPNWDYLDILIAVDSNSRVIARQNNNISGDRISLNNTIQEAIAFNRVIRSTENINREFLMAESEELAEQIKVDVAPADTAIAWDTDTEIVTSALSKIVIVPISDAAGNVLGAFVACDIINKDYWLVDELKEKQSLTATIFNNDGIRVSTNVTNVRGDRGLGSIISEEVMETILTGKNYTGKAKAVGREYLTVYEPMKNNAGELAGVFAIGMPLDAFARIESGAKNTILLFLIGGVFFTIILAYVTTSYFIIPPINHLLSVMSEIELGNYSVRSSLQTGDELETLSKGLDSMLDRLVQFIRTEEDTQRMQQQIIDLLVTVSNASEGDLTATAEVTSDELGSVADAFNVMLEGISDLVKRVKESGTQVSSSANEILASSEQIASGAERQILEINNTTSAVEEMSISMSQVSDNANAAAEAAQNSKDAAMQGGTDVQEVIEGMRRIRDTVQTTAKKIKTLGDRSLEIGEIVDVINEIAAQTNMLALNAAIEAARAGEHGRGFAVVADKVQDLAERSTAATKDIAALIKGIQNETNEAVVAMEEGTREVEEGTKLADSAGQSLHKIETSATQTADLVQEISLAAKQQVRGIDGVVKAMESISMVTKQTSKGVEQTISTIEHLVKMSDELQDAISNFTIEAEE